ncbi:MAG: LysR family transcriptional regulator [Opitutus sp.]
MSNERFSDGPFSAAKHAPLVNESEATASAATLGASQFRKGSMISHRPTTRLLVAEGRCTLALSMPENPRHYFKELRLQQFRSLVALARWQTFSAAASALKLTRGSVWQQIRALEQEFACALLRTRGQRVELTPAGHKLVEIAAPLVAGFDSVKSGFTAAIKDELPQTLVIAAAPNFLVQELREPIRRIHAEFPNLHLTFLERNSGVAAEILDQGGADLAIVARPDHVKPRPALEYTSLGSYPFTLICPPGHPLVKKRRLTLLEVTKHPLILPGNGTYCRQQFDAALEQEGLTHKTRIVIESNFPAMLFEYVRLGFGVAMSPLPADQSGSSPWHGGGVELRPISELLTDEPIYFVRRKGQFETAVAARFRELVTTRVAPKS